MLVETLELVRAREQAEAWDKSEAQLATALSTLLPKQELDGDIKDLFRPFMQWASSANVRHLPARPTTVASFIFKQFDAGVKPDTILEQVSAIERLHDFFAFSNPVATSAARAALNEIVSIEVPRSWPKEEKAMFMHLPPQIRTIIADRERDRERALRRGQNELAELKKRLTKTAPELSKPVEDNKEIEMAKRDWNEKRGPYTSDDPGLKQDDSALGYQKPVDISRRVDKAWVVNDGFSGKMPSDE